MKKILLLMIIFLIPIVYGLDECHRLQSPQDIPCQVTLTWILPNDCSTYSVDIYSEDTQSLLESKVLNNMSIYCSFEYDNTETGSYYFNYTSGDTGSITVREDGEMEIAFLLGILIFGLVNYFLIFRKSIILGAFGYFMLSLSLLVPFNNSNYLVIAWIAIGIAFVGMVVSIAYSKSQQIDI